MPPIHRFHYFVSDFDRTGSSPPKQNSQLTTTPYTPGSGQKRFNPFMKDTPTSNSAIDSPSENATDIAIHKDTTAQQPLQQQHNDENKNIIILDDDNNQNILSTSNRDNHNQTLTTTTPTPKTYIDDDTKLATNNDSDSNEMTTSQTEAPLPDWIALNESVLIRPYNHSGVISFIGPTHFSVGIDCHLAFSFLLNVLCQK